MKIVTRSREYRKDFSKAYKILYREDDLCYLTEVLDSAQEGIQCLWVNSEKYSFSAEVLNLGTKLYDKFCNLLITTRNLYQKYFKKNKF